MKKFLLSLCLFCSVCSAQSWTLDFENVNIKPVAREFSNIFKKNFIVADDVNINVNMNVKKPSNPDELYNYFLSVLKLHNLRAIEKDGVILITHDLGGFEVFKLKNANAQNVANILTSLSIPDFTVVSDVANNSILVKSKSLNNISDLVTKLDVDRKQILISAVIVEVSADDVEQLGIQWVLGSQNGYGVVNLNPKANLQSILSKNHNLSVLGGLLGVGKQSDNKFYGAVLQALDQSTNTNLLSNPSVLVLENEQANILIGQNIPFLTGSYSKDDGREFQIIERQDVGVSLKVLPTIVKDNHVKLKVYQEVSSVVNTSNASGIITNKSVIDTTIVAENNQTIVLGGLVRNDFLSDSQNVPKVSKIPILGNLFKSNQSVIKKSNLLIFLQPNILDNDYSIPVYTDFIDNKVYKLSFENGSIVKTIVNQ